MTKILIIGDSGVPDGYGRIADNVALRLHKRGYQIFAASIAYDGLLPPQYDGVHLPYWVASMAGHPNWTEQVAGIINSVQPDVVWVVQDAPYSENVRNIPLDWSRHKFIMTCAVDGVPVYPQWLKTAHKADAVLSISQFGVDALKRQGVEAKLLQPGIDPDRFFALPTEKRLELRAKLGIKPDAFVLGVVAQNQGRKDVPSMVRGFFQFASDKPDARLLLDMERLSPAGWDIPGMICEPNGYDVSKIIFRDDCIRAGVTDLRERYNVMDAHTVLAHREGFGIPLVEAQACGVVSIAMDYTSGTEICGADKGVLVKPLPFHQISTWGGAVDKFPDIDHFVAGLQMLYDQPERKTLIAQAGMAWSRSHTWDGAADVVMQTIERVLSGRRGENVVQLMPVVTPTAVANPSPDGVVKDVQLVEAIP
jgi:glycosyltransferase involved in cell wall biosynthesis